jgi:hypothetical protein
MNDSSEQTITIDKSQMIDQKTGESLFDTDKGNISEGDYVLITAHTVKEKQLKAKVNLEMRPCLDETEVNNEI